MQADADALRVVEQARLAQNEEPLPKKAAEVGEQPLQRDMPLPFYA